MIRRPRVLDPSEVPDQELIVHRGSYIDDVYTTMRHVRQGRADTPFILAGPPGTGKTMAARYVLRQYADRDHYRTAYVDCWQDYDTYHLLAQVVDGLGLTVVHHDSTPEQDFVDALQQDSDETWLVILDEIEMVQDDDALDVLATADVPIIGIGNDVEEIAATLDPVFGDIVDHQVLQFPAYAVGELKQIVAKRAEYGLVDDALDAWTAERIGEAADGDARLGICILREAARASFERDEDAISPDVLNEAAEAAQQELHEANLARLTDHQRALYEIIASEGALPPRELYRRYRERDGIDEPRSRKTVQTYLQKMQWYGLLKSAGATRSKRYRIDGSGYVNPDAVP